jgi:hypothetical protein
VTSHFNAEELIAAIDGDLSPAQHAHLDECQACRSAVTETRQALDAARFDMDVPEPSPLFWDHLSSRVREATRGEGAPRRESWWLAAWKPLLAGAFAATLVWAVGVRPDFLRRAPADAAIEATSSPAAATWDDVVAQAGGLSDDDMSTVAPVVGDSSMLVEDMTPAERDAFATLLEREIGRLQ